MKTIEQFLAEKIGMENEKVAGMLIGFAIYRELEEERARLQLLAKALRDIYQDGLQNVLEPVIEGGECWTVKQTEASHTAQAALTEAGLDKEPA